MTPLERLFEREGLPRSGLPPALAALYGGDLGIARPCMYANFVASVDGVVALPIGGESGAVVSGGSEPDRFVMGLLRAMADAVLVGAGTFRKAAGDLWTPDAVYPAGGAHFAQLRRQMGLRPQPLLVIASASGAIDIAQPALRDALVVTSPEGAARLQGKLPTGARLRVLDQQPADARPLLELLRAEDLRAVLTEGGPSLFGELLSQRLINEIFVTSSPRLFGRWPDDQRKSLVAGRDLGGRELDLASVHRHGSHLFLRYTL